MYFPSTEKTPSIIIPPSNRTLELGRTAGFRCNTTGDPSPSVTWQKNDVEIIKGTPRYYVQESSKTLFIFRVRRSDVARYTCVAQNIYGSTRAEAYLKIVAGEKSFVKRYLMPNGVLKG